MGPSLFVQLLPAGGSTAQASPLPSVQHNGHQYMIAEAGVEFEVRVQVLNPSPGQHYSLALSLDGQDVGYVSSATVEKNFASTFRGWLHNVGDGRLHFRRFKFGECRPLNSATTVEHPDQITAGKIEVSWCADYLVGTETPSYKVTTVQVDNSAASRKLPEGKKWFLQPGLKAEVGSLCSDSSYWSSKKYQKLYSLPTLVVKYDTAENLKLRNILKPSNPQHAAILRNSNNTRVAALLAADRAAAHDVQKGRSQQQAQKGSKKRGVKRERQEQHATDDGDQQEAQVVLNSATGDTISLCDEGRPSPLKVNGRALKTDELAICDLRDSDDEEALGRWKIKKKQVITV